MILDVDGPAVPLAGGCESPVTQQYVVGQLRSVPLEAIHVTDSIGWNENDLDHACRHSTATEIENK